MPALIAPAIASALSVSAATALTIAQIGLYAAVTAAQYFLSQANQPKEKTGTKLTAASGGDVPLSIIFGEKESAGSLIYAGSYGISGKTPNGFLVQVYALADTETEDILSRCWVNGTKATLDTSGTSTVDGNNVGYPCTTFRESGVDYLWVKIHHGSQTSADSYLRDKFGSHATKPWTSDMIGRGRTYMIVTARYNKDEGSSAWPAVAVVLKGAKFYDWRLDSTNGGSGSHRYGTKSTYEYTANPIVIIYNIMRGIYYGSEWLYGGQAWSERRFDNDAWTAAANVCDENVTLASTATEKRYRAGGEINLDEDPLDVIDRLLSSCNGRLVESGGVFKVYCGGIGSSVMSVTDDDFIITEPFVGRMFPGHTEIVNKISGTYIEPDNGGQPKAYKPRTDSDYVDDDAGEVLEIQLNYDYVRSNTRAQRLSKHALKDGRRMLTKNGGLGPNGRKLEPGDVVNVNSDRFGFVNKKFISGDVELRQDGITILSLREADATDADWDVSDEEAYSVGVYGPEAPGTETIVFTASAYAIVNNAGTNVHPGFKIEWDWDEDNVDVKAVQWKLRESTSGAIIARGRTDDPEDGEVIINKRGIVKANDYDLTARFIPYSDRPTSWASWQTVTADDIAEVITTAVLDDTVPDVPTGLTLTQIAKDVDGDGTVDIAVKATWDSVAAANSYALQITQGSDVSYVQNDDTSYIFKAKTKLYSVKVRAKTVFGIKSALSSAVTITPTKKTTAAAAPTSLTVKGLHKRNKVTFSKSTENDYKESVIYAAQGSTSFGSATEVGRVKGNVFIHDDLTQKSTYTYWVTHVTTSDVESATYPSSGGAGTNGTVVNITAADVISGADTTNFILNPSFDNGSTDGWIIDAAGAPVLKTSAPDTPPTEYVMETAGDTSDVFHYYDSFIPVHAGEQFYGEIILDTDGSTNHNMEFGLHAVDSDYGGGSWVPCVERTAGQGNALNGVAWQKAAGILLVPESVGGTGEKVAYCRPYVRIFSHASPAGNWYFGNVRIHRAVEGGAITDGAIDTGNIATGAATSQQSAYTSGSVTVSGSSTLIQEVVSDHGVGAEGVTLLGQFKNNAGGSRTFEVVFTRDGTGDIFSFASVTVPGGSVFNMAYLYPSPADASSTFVMRIRSPDSSFGAVNRQLIAIANKK